jgi:spore germination protein
MIIHVVKPGETIQSIAKFYGVSENDLIQNNGLDFTENLVVGQCIVITYPEIIYTVKEGDSLYGITNSFNVSVMQLLQNNPYLADRKYLYPGDKLVISFKKKGSLTTHGIVIPFVTDATLKRTLPYLTYISVINYTVTDQGDLISYYDDTEFIKTAKNYNVIPLMFITTLTLQGKDNIETVYKLLLNEESQDRLIENILTTLKNKGYYGINFSFELVNPENLPYIENACKKIVNALKNEGYLAFATINPHIIQTGKDIDFLKIDYSHMGEVPDSLIFTSYEWAINPNPPSPISSVYGMETFLNYIKGSIPSTKISIGLATIGYNWELPYRAGISRVYSLTYDSAVALARNENIAIQFDEISQTPFFLYTSKDGQLQTEHIVWFIDARSISALLNLVFDYSLYGISVWNITVFNAQLWLIINSQYDIIKFNNIL